MNINAIESNIKYKNKLDIIYSLSSRKDLTAKEFEQFNHSIASLYFNIMQDNFHFDYTESTKCLIYGFHFYLNDQYINCGFVNNHQVNSFKLGFNFYFSSEGKIRDGFNMFQIEFKTAYIAMKFLMNNIELIKSVSKLLFGKAKVENLNQIMFKNNFKSVKPKYDEKYSFLFKPIKKSEYFK